MAGPSIGSILNKVKLPTVHTKKGPSIGPGGVIGTSPKVGGVGINTQSRKVSVPGKEVNIGGVIVNRPPVSVGGNSGGIGGFLNKVKLPTAHTKFGAIGPGGFIGKFPGAAGVQTKITTSGIKAILPSRNINIGGLEFNTPGINEVIDFPSVSDVLKTTNTTGLISGKGGVKKNIPIGVNSDGTFNSNDILNTTDTFNKVGVATDGQRLLDNFGNADPNKLSNSLLKDGFTTDGQPIVDNFGNADPTKLVDTLDGFTTDGQPIVDNFGNADPTKLVDTLDGFTTDGQPIVDKDPNKLGVQQNTKELPNTIGLVEPKIDKSDNKTGVKTSFAGQNKKKPVYIRKNFDKADPEKVFKENAKRGHVPNNLIEKVLAQVKKRDFARPTDYEIVITLSEKIQNKIKNETDLDNDFVQRQLSFNAESAMHVSETFDMIRTSYTEIFSPSERIMGSLVVNFNVSSDMKELKFFRTWMNSIIDARSYKIAYTNDITAEMEVRQLDRKNRVTYIDTYERVFPKIVTEMALDYKDTNNILRLPVTFDYRVKKLNEMKTDDGKIYTGKFLAV